MMDLLGRGELGLLGGGPGLTEDVPSIMWSGRLSQEDTYGPPGLALAAAYQDIKSRLASLERENSSIKRKLQHYELKFPMMSDYEPVLKDNSEVQLQNTSLQQKISSLTQELEKSKEREERLEELIQAYEKIHLEKNNVQRDLDKMTSLAEQHMEQICSLESALRQRDTSLHKLSSHLGNNHHHHHVRTHTSLDVPTDGRGPMLQSSRSLDALSDLKLQRLVAELQGVRHQAEDACQRESQLRVQLHRLQQDVAHMKDRQCQDLSTDCEHCNVEWIKKAGDEQVNLALAYTELNEELCHIRELVAKQTQFLRQASPESAVPQRLCPSSPQRASSLSPDRLLPLPSPPLSPNQGPASHSYEPTSSRLRAKFQSRRSYSEVSDPSAVHRPMACFMRDPVSTLPKPRALLGKKSYGQIKGQLHAALGGVVRPASAHGVGSDRVDRGTRGGGSMSNSPRHCPVHMDFPLAAEVHHLCRLEDPLEPTPLVTPPQSSDEDEDVYLSPAASPPAVPREPQLHHRFQSPRNTKQHAPFSAPERPTISCHLPTYIRTEHAQSWPSINLWMESEESAVRSCPLCQLTFPTTYPDDALIKHIDSHLENSKI